VNQAALDLPCMHGVLRALGEQHDAELGVVASVRIPGVVAVGDAVERID